ncbi:MAG TPA: hypothetical protein PLC89_04475 [Haliscomenobacter sp.]|uniref:hypothetical protein n=1 Tax=Haliscomenobacter sp. TaxID=2717303 RepID=UPI002C5D7D11|nr:hypothetical protein [Haliscomenobacter sp.]HOY16522.1 hypothetical protein [Haliscomenobacter sp.]
MKRTTLSSFFLLISCSLFSQQILTNYQESKDTLWGSVSAEKPNFGFYGHEFSFSKNAQIKTFSAFIVDRKKHDETKSTINFSIWTFDQKPQKELFRSKAVAILSSEIDNWKTYTFSKPLKLKKGNYLFAVGQSEIQGFVAFRSGWAKEGDSGKFWMMSPFDGFSDGKTWFQGNDLLRFTGASEEEIKKIESAVTRMKIEYK